MKKAARARTLQFRVNLSENMAPPLFAKFSKLAPRQLATRAIVLMVLGERVESGLLVNAVPVAAPPSSPAPEAAPVESIAKSSADARDALTVLEGVQFDDLDPRDL